MPVLESADGAGRGMPRSSLRYRALHETNKRSVVTTAAHPVVAQRASRARVRPADDDLISEWARGDHEELEPETNPEQPLEEEPPVRRTKGSQPPVNTRPQPQNTPVPPLPTPSRGRGRGHPFLYLGLGMLGMVALWAALTAGQGWWSNYMDTLHYGYPRTSQMDAVVGHNDSPANRSHFIALNLHGHIEIIEFPGGDAEHARIFLGPQIYGNDADKAPVTLKFIDINGDQRPDMLVFFQSSWIVFINANGTFRSPTVDEQQDATRYLATHKQS